MMRQRRRKIAARIVATVWGVALPIAGFAQTPAPPPTPTDAGASVPADYRLDIGDTIGVMVLRHPEVSTNVLIPADGLVRLPLLSAPIPARGKTTGELIGLLGAGWKHEFKLHPGQISVSVVGQRTRRVYVRGSGVKSPGEFALQPDMRLSNVIALAGNVTLPDRVEVSVTNQRRAAPVKIDLAAALSRPGGPADIPVLEGDVVTVEQPPTIRLLVYGEGPRGQHEIDWRFGLRRALASLGFTTNNAPGSLQSAQLIRKTVPGDPSSPEEIVPVNLLALMKPDSPEIALKDQDLLYIPPTENYVYVFGEAGGPRKQFLPEDKKTYLVDVIGNTGGTSPNARIGAIGIQRTLPDGKVVRNEYDFGRYLRDGDSKNNPEVQAKDIIVIPKVGTRVGFGEIFNGFGVFNIFRSLIGR